MKKSQQIKRRHHHVWEYYLKKWSVGNKVFKFTPTLKIIDVHTKGESRTDYFYKLNFMDESDVLFVCLLISKAAKEQQADLKLFLQDFLKVTHLEREFRQAGPLTLDQHGEIFRQQCNSLEDRHAEIESSVVDIIDCLARGEICVLDNAKSLRNFCYFLGVQSTRTEAFKTKIITTFYEKPDLPSQHILAPEKWEKNWPFISLMLGLNLGYSLYIERKIEHHRLLINRTDLPFITGDWPVINIHQSLNLIADDEAPEKMDLYFPLSPEYAYVIFDSASEVPPTEITDRSYIEHLNLSILNTSNSIYSNKESVLEGLKEVWRTKKNS